MPFFIKKNLTLFCFNYALIWILSVLGVFDTKPMGSTSLFLLKMTFINISNPSQLGGDKFSISLSPCLIANCRWRSHGDPFLSLSHSVAGPQSEASACKRSPAHGGWTRRCFKLRQYIHRPWRIISKLEVGRRSEDYAMTCWAAEQWYSITAVANHLPARSSLSLHSVPLRRAMPTTVCVCNIYGGSINIHRCRRVTRPERERGRERTIKLISTCGRPLLLLLLSFPLSLLVSHNSRVTLLLREKSHLHALMLGHNTFREGIQRERRKFLRVVTKELCPENFCADTWKLKFRRLFHSPLWNPWICSLLLLVCAAFSFFHLQRPGPWWFTQREDVFAKWLAGDFRRLRFYCCSLQ